MTNSNDTALLALEDEFFDAYNAGHRESAEALVGRIWSLPALTPEGWRVLPAPG